MSSSDEPISEVSSEEAEPQEQDLANESAPPVNRIGGAIFLATLLTAILLVVEVVGGTYSGSLSLLADACYMLADLIALLVVWVSIRRISNHNPEDDAATCGRMMLQVGYGIGVLLVILGLVVGLEATRRLVFGEIQIMPKLMFWIAVIGLIVNVICWLILAKANSPGNVVISDEKDVLPDSADPAEDDTVGGDTVGADTVEESLLSARQHTLNDTLGSIAVAAAALAIIYGSSWFIRIDAILAICLALLMLINGSVAVVANTRKLREIIDENESSEPDL